MVLPAEEFLRRFLLHVLPGQIRPHPLLRTLDQPPARKGSGAVPQASASGPAPGGTAPRRRLARVAPAAHPPRPGSLLPLRPGRSAPGRGADPSVGWESTAVTAGHRQIKIPRATVKAWPAGGVLDAAVSCTIATTKSLRESPAVRMQPSLPALSTREVRFLRAVTEPNRRAAAPLRTIDSP
jgi:hypothetical protein